MSITMTIKDGYNDFRIHKNKVKGSVYALNPGITILTGCNGYGKTTTINEMKQWCDHNEYEYYYFGGNADGGSKFKAQCTLNGDFRSLANFISSSEGEQLLAVFTKFCQKTLSKSVKCAENQKPFILFIDAIDSGLSVDSISMVRSFLIRFMHDAINKYDAEVYIVSASNSFEMCRSDNLSEKDRHSFRCMDPYAFKDVSFKSYNRYVNFIKKTAKILEARYDSNEEEK